MVCSIRPSFTCTTSAGRHPWIGKALLTTRVPGFSFSRRRAQPLVGSRHEEHGHQCRRRQVDAQRAAFHDAHAILQPKRQDAFPRLLAQVRHDLDPHRVRSELLRRGDDDPPVAAAQIVDHIVGGHTSGLEHLVHDDLRGGDLGAEILRRPKLLGRRRNRDGCEQVRCDWNPHSNHWAAGPVAVTVLPTFDFSIRPMMSVQAKNKSRGRLIVNSAPLSVFTALPMASRHGLTVGFRL